MASTNVLVPILLVLLLGGAHLVAGKCTDQQDVIYYNTQNYSAGSAYERNLNNLLSYLIKAPGNSVVSVTVGSSPDVVYGRAECYGNCGHCLVNVKNAIKNAAPLSIGARECTASCYLRFESYSF